MGIFGVDGRFVRQLQRADERGLELGKEVQRPAQECNVTADRLAAGKTRDRLVDDRLKDRGGEVGFRRALVDEGLNVRLGEYAAARGDGIDLLIVRGLAVKPRGIGLQKSSHLVDERAGAAGADAVHAFFQPAFEVNDLGVLAAELNGNVYLRRGALQRLRYGHDLLHEGHAERLGEVDRTGTRGAQRKRAFTEYLVRLLEQVGQRALRVGKMALILPENHVFVFVQNNELHRGGAYVDASLICFHWEPLFSCRCDGAVKESRRFASYHFNYRPRMCKR